MKLIIDEIKDYEDEKTRNLFEELKGLSEQGFCTKHQLLSILRWKSPRPLKHYESNTERDIIAATQLAFSTKSDALKIHILTALKGVNYPAASAILMFYNRSKYPVLDIRVWQQLHKANLVTTNQNGKNFTLQEWVKYLNVIRGLARELGLTARQVEKRLFDYDKKTRPEKLYKING